MQSFHALSCYAVFPPHECVHQPGSSRNLFFGFLIKVILARHDYWPLVIELSLHPFCLPEEVRGWGWKSSPFNHLVDFSCDQFPSWSYLACPPPNLSKGYLISIRLITISIRPLSLKTLLTQETHHSNSKDLGALCQELEIKTNFFFFFNTMALNRTPAPTLSIRITRSRRRQEKLPDRSVILILWCMLDYSGKLIKNVDSWIWLSVILSHWGRDRSICIFIYSFFFFFFVHAGS